jgi:hypothetical protein
LRPEGKLRRLDGGSEAYFRPLVLPGSTVDGMSLSCKFLMLLIAFENSRLTFFAREIYCGWQGVVQQS